MLSPSRSSACFPLLCKHRLPFAMAASFSSLSLPLFLWSLLSLPSPPCSWAFSLPPWASSQSFSLSGWPPTSFCFFLPRCPFSSPASPPPHCFSSSLSLYRPGLASPGFSPLSECLPLPAPVRTTEMEQNDHCWRKWGATRTSGTLGGRANGCKHFENGLAVSTHAAFMLRLAIPCLGVFREEKRAYTRPPPRLSPQPPAGACRRMWNVPASSILKSPNWTEPKWPLAGGRLIGCCCIGTWEMPLGEKRMNYR